ncbi:MAG: hypothetical protein R2754_16710 [Microthrixaceae bacterium]
MPAAVAVVLALLLGACGDEVEQPQADALITFDHDNQVVGYRGGSLTQEQLDDIAATPLVEAPMPVIFGAFADEELTQRAKNQVRAIIASATEDRGNEARVDPVWVRRNSEEDVEILVVVDNPGATDLDPITIDVELVNRLEEPKGDESFQVQPDQLDAVPAGMAAFLILTMDKGRLSEADVDITQTGVKAELADN